MQTSIKVINSFCTSHHPMREAQRFTMLFPCVITCNMPNLYITTKQTHHTFLINWFFLVKWMGKTQNHNVMSVRIHIIFLRTVVNRKWQLKFLFFSSLLIKQPSHIQLLRWSSSAIDDDGVIADIHVPHGILYRCLIAITGAIKLSLSLGCEIVATE